MRVMSVWKAAAAWAAIAATGASAIAAPPVEPPAPKHCISAGQARALITFMLPPLMGEVSRQCANVLSASALLSSIPDTLMDEYQAAADAAWPEALRGFVTMTGKELSETEALFARPLISALIGPALVERLATRDCPVVNDLITALRPLPPSNLAAALIAIVELSGADKKDKSPLQICPRDGR